MTRVLYPGSFDPVHLGHVEIVESASALFDSVVVATVGNPQKGGGLFSIADRTAMLEESFAHLSNVEVMSFSTLVVNVARDVGADFIVKGLRVVQDFESELQMAQMNKEISGVETMFLPTASRRSFLASKLIREIASFGGDVSSMVPAPVLDRLAVRFADQDLSQE